MDRTRKRKTAPDGDQTDNNNAKRLKKPTITLSRGTKKRVSEVEPEPEVPIVAGVPDGADYEGKSFSQAQEQLLEEFTKYYDRDGLQVYQPFIFLPQRSLTDYYQLIKKPTSLNTVTKKTRGHQQRGAATGISDFKTWDAFEEEVAYIWNNARTYNEDGSDMFILASQFEEAFKIRYADVKSKVEEPHAPRIKLNARPRPVLHLGGGNKTTNTSLNTLPDLAITTTELPDSRDDKKVTRIDSGERTPRPRRERTPSMRATSQQAEPESQNMTRSATRRATSRVGSLAPPDATQLSTVKSETNGRSPGPAEATSVKTGGSPASSVALPSDQTTNPSADPLLQMALKVIQPGASDGPAPPVPKTFSDTFKRTRPISEALLPSVSLSTHPQLAIAKPFEVDVDASQKWTQNSITVILPRTHYYLQLAPTVSQQFASGRQYKLFVTINGSRVSPTMRALQNGDLSIAGERKQVYDFALSPGINRIETEIAAVPSRGGGLELEKIIIFAHLTRY